MTVLILDSPHPAIRGQLKRWFVELRPSVFVSSINAMVMENVIQYLNNYGALDGVVVSNSTNSQGYVIRGLGASKHRYQGIALGELSLILRAAGPAALDSDPF